MNKAGFSQNGQLNGAVAGLGWWGKVIIEALKDNPKIRVVKTIDPVPAAGDWAKTQGLDFATDYNAALADPKVGGVILCTPHSLHAEQVESAARAKKHVFCEKPLALTRRDAVAEVEACKANGVILAVGHEHRFKPAMQDILRMVRAGELGTIQMTEATLTLGLRPLAADAERELVEWKKVRFMAERVGEEFDALIISAAKYGVFVELAELFIEGLVPIDTLPGDEYTYHENVRKIVGKRTRREFSIGDRVRVMLDRVDANERKLQFSMVENERDSPRTKRPDSHSRRRVSDGPGKRPRR